MKPTSEIIIYDAGQARVEVRLDQETVWLTQEQMAQLFGRERSVITKHVRNVFAEGELDEKSNVQNLHIAGSDKPVRFYNLDVIISVGYRVKSQQGTRFRQWATRVLREYLTRGYSLDRQRFERNAAELEAALALVRKAAAGEALTAEQGRGLVDVIARYTHTFLWLLRYDEDLLTAPAGSPGGAVPTLYEARGHRPPQGRPDGAARGVRTVRAGARRGLRGNPRQPGADRLWRAGLPHDRNQGCTPAVLCHQEPPVLGRQQAHRGVFIHRFSRPQRAADARR